MKLPRKLVLASDNSSKYTEFSAALAEKGIELVPQSHFGVPGAAETADSFTGNALLKAQNAARHCRLPVLADDSGLEVAALGGAPGIYSARYAGSNATSEDNNRKLLAALKNVEDQHRQAQFVCVVALVFPNDEPPPMVARAEWKGMILRRPRGSAGFGYDPLFLVPHTNRSAAQLSPAEKWALSHRGQALQALLKLE